MIKPFIRIDFLLLAFQVERCKASEKQSKRVVRELKSVLVLFYFLIFLETYNTFSLYSTSGWEAEGVGEEGGESNGQATES